ncbi:BON domain-containing protein [Phenylobacterium sp.]|uniref:BON domain-containing protein n=1 Tax=Phenylobacterium sp. TaxID=1871053 RepID=UPI003BAD83A2
MAGRYDDRWDREDVAYGRDARRDGPLDDGLGGAPGEARSFRSIRAAWPGPEHGGEFTGPRYGAGGYGQNGSDPGRRVSSYGDRVYRGGVGGGGPAEDYRRGGDRHGPADLPYGAEYGAVWPGADLGRASHRGLGPKGYRRSDERINEDVHDRLTEDPHIDASGIVVMVQEGEVTLSGSVSDRRAKHHAEAIIEHIAGVTHVQNNLRADPGEARGPTPLGENTVLRDQAQGEKP